MLKVLVGGVLAFVIGCQTAAQKRVGLVQDRATKLKPLGVWRPLRCELQIEYTAPALARYKQMFPKEKINENFVVAWKAREDACSLETDSKGLAVDNMKPLLETGVCLLLQTHWVNSPFDDLQLTEDDVAESADGFVHVRTGSGGVASQLGIFLQPDDFVIETRTKSRGVLSARYANVQGDWLPIDVRQDLNGAQIAVEEVTWASEKTGLRRLPQEFWLAVGKGRALRHSHVTFGACERL